MADERNPLHELMAPATEVHSGNVDKVLHAVRTHLGMDVAFVAEFRQDDRVFRYVDARDRSPIRAGDAVPLEVGYCQRVVDGRLPQLIRDAQRVPAAAALPETQSIPIGAHLSVPIILSDGRVYGTFCCFSFMPDVSLTERDLQMMKAFADLLSDQISEEIQALQEQSVRVRRITELLDIGQPEVVFQPIYDTVSRRLTGIEALSRFEVEPRRTPDVWFAEAARIGVGPTLEAAAVRSALPALAHMPKDVYVALNASPSFIVSGRLQQTLHSAELDRVVLELTEHASVDDYRELLDILAPMRAMGLRIAVDDTGAGYASMRHILNVEPDIVKLDISLTRGIEQDRKRRALATALITFALETEVDIVAEGIETEAQLHTLHALGVTKMQGYLLGRPMALHEISMMMPTAAARTARALAVKQAEESREPDRPAAAG